MVKFAPAFEAISALIGARFTTAPGECAQHAGSESWHSAPPPDAVAFVESTEEVSEIMRICHEHRCPVIGWGAGTSLEGHALAVQGGLILDLSRMNKLIQLRAEDMQVTVQPGMTRRALESELRASGLFFSVDPGADATLGGMAATRASGTTTVRYGSMRDNVLALVVVLADGRVIRTGTRAAKSSAGYDLTALMLGSEGTLGIITELTLRLHGQPEDTATAICGFDTLEDAVNCVALTIQAGLPMARIEFVDASVAKAFNDNFDSHFAPTPHLLVEFHGTPDAVKADAASFGEFAAEFGARDFEWAVTAEDRNRLWRMRHEGYHACLRLRPAATAVITDVCVPMSELAGQVAMARDDIAQSGLIGPILGHVGDGNFHSALLIEPGNAEELAAAKAVAGRMCERAIAVGGTISGEHGIGVGKRGYMMAQHGDAWAVMGAIKTALDPQGILNPGKLVPDL